MPGLGTNDPAEALARVRVQIASSVEWSEDSHHLLSPATPLLWLRCHSFTWIVQPFGEPSNLTVRCYYTGSLMVHTW